MWSFLTPNCIQSAKRTLNRFGFMRMYQLYGTRIKKNSSARPLRKKFPQRGLSKFIFPLNLFFSGECLSIFLFWRSASKNFLFSISSPPRSLLVAPLRCLLKLSGTNECHSTNILSSWLLDWFLFKEYLSELEFGNHD